jgi:hypothetical protein
MNNRYHLQKERLERIRKEGPAKFILKYGLSFALLFGCFVFFVSKPPVPNVILATLILIGGILFGIGMWLFMMWQYKNYHKR